jgi:hypothetical protein
LKLFEYSKKCNKVVVNLLRRFDIKIETLIIKMQESDKTTGEELTLEQTIELCRKSVKETYIP